MTLPRKVAFCTVPHVGGIYSVYRKLRGSVAPSGWQVYGVQVGAELDRWEYREDLADQGIRRIAVEERDLKRAAKAFCDWVASESIGIVIPMCSPAAVAAVPHLPPEVKVVTRCINANIQAYRLAATNIPRLSKIVYTSPRQKREIGSRFRIPDESFVHIPNAVDTEVFSCMRGSPREADEPISIIYVGRLIQLPKNIFALSEIADHLAQSRIPFRLRVVGSGPDEASLRSAMKHHCDTGRVEFLGSRSQQEIIQYFHESDCQLLPSEEEGFPNVLVEAMSCGVVPVASRLEGITDWIVEDQVNGRLCPFNRAQAFANAVADLQANPEQTRRLGEAARKTVVDRFAIQQFGRNWEQLFTSVSKDVGHGHPPLPWSQFQPNPAFRPSRFRWIPRNVRNMLRASLDKTGIRSR